MRCELSFTQTAPEAFSNFLNPKYVPKSFSVRPLLV